MPSRGQRLPNRVSSSSLMLILLFCFGTGQEREEAEKLFKAGGMAQKVVKAKLTDEEQAKIKVKAATPKCSASRTFFINSEILHYGDRKYANIFTTEFEASLATLNSIGAHLLNPGPKG